MPRRHYPNTLKSFLHGPEKALGDDRAPSPPSLSADDLRYALREIDEYIDVSEEDLGRIFRISATHARRKRMGEILIGEIMTRDVVTANYDTPVETLWRQMGRYKIKGIPVIDPRRRVIGIVTIADFLNQVHLISWVLVSGIHGERLVVIFRCDGYKKNAGKLAQKIFGKLGSAGGHREMARAEVPLKNLELAADEFTTRKLMQLATKHI